MTIYTGQTKPSYLLYNVNPTVFTWDGGPFSFHPGDNKVGGKQLPCEDEYRSPDDVDLKNLYEN